MKLFKSTDEKLKEIGFEKIQDDNYGVTYERFNMRYNYTQVLTIVHKKSGNHIIQSYDKNLFDSKGIGNTCVGLTYRETKLIMKKIKEKGWKPKNRKGDKKDGK